MSRPVRARGLKPGRIFQESFIFPSRPVRARGLKPEPILATLDTQQSRPVRARGLKRGQSMGAQQRHDVAPRAGAWIETGI